MIALTMTLILDVEDSSAAADAANEMLRHLQRGWSPESDQSCLIDYAVNLPVVDLTHIPVAVSYSEGEAFA